MELEECIKDALEESMKPYISSEEYVKNKQEVTKMITVLRGKLRTEEQAELNRLLDAITVSDGAFASEAYMHGVVEGMALRDKVLAEN